jgi:hypothetical protein
VVFFKADAYDGGAVFEDEVKVINSDERVFSFPPIFRLLPVNGSKGIEFCLSNFM